MTWIAVLDKKPNDLQRVLIFDQVNEYVIGYFDHAAGLFIGCVDGARINHALFWKFLPESPMQVEEKTAELQPGDTII